MSADAEEAENNTWCGYNYVQMAIFCSRGLFEGLKRELRLALYTSDVLLCLGFSRLVPFVSLCCLAT